MYRADTPPAQTERGQRWAVLSQSVTGLHGDSVTRDDTVMDIRSAQAPLMPTLPPPLGLGLPPPHLGLPPHQLALPFQQPGIDAQCRYRRFAPAMCGVSGQL